ncbi:MAG: CvpA family protein [Sphaerochaetaceae bacterium]|nr:CvpA family protein [Sphaerochaetaceae bacterium]
MGWTIAVGSLEFGILDIVMLIVLIASSVGCCLKGFISEFSHWGGLMAAYFTGIMFTKPLAVKLTEVLPSLPAFVPALLAFVILAVIAYILIHILGSLLERMADAFYLGYVDNILGFIWGLAIAAFIIGFIIWILKFQNVIDFTPMFENSWFYKNIFDTGMEIVQTTFREAF